MTNRQKLWLAQDRQKVSYRRAFRPLFVSAIDRQIVPVLELLKEANDIRDFIPVLIDNSPVEETYKQLYLTTAVDFAKKKRAALKKSYLKGDSEIFEDMIQDNVRTYLRIYGGSTITAVGDTSLSLIKELVRDLTTEIIDRNLTASEGITMLRDRIQSEWHRAARYRTERIVRTEVNRASNYGSLEGMKSIGVEMKKVWLSAFTEKSRPTHMDADGQKVGLNEPFEVGSEFLQYPGDPKGSAGETINCLCSMYESLS